MDPNEALKMMREAVAYLRSVEPPDSPDSAVVAELIDAAEALDGWLSKGGFLPRDWQRNR